MNLIIVKCPSCGANLDLDEDKKEITCEFCKSKIINLKASKINDFVEGLNEIDQKKFENFVSIFKQSFDAGNYYEAYNYCNKALEINPRSPEIWENKAICCFWLQGNKSLTDNFTEITTYLNASRNINPESESLIKLYQEISYNLFILYTYRFLSFQKSYQNKPGTNYSVNDFLETEKKEMIECLNLIEKCYQLNPDIEYLETLCNLILSGKLNLVTFVGGNPEYNNTNEAVLLKYDASLKLTKFISIIKKCNPDYEPPKQKDNTILIIIVAVIIFIIFLIFGSK